MLEKSITGVTVTRGVIPRKVIFDIDNGGSFLDGLIIYDVTEDGKIVSKNKSIGIKSDISIPAVNGMLQDFVRTAAKAEGLVDTHE